MRLFVKKNSGDIHALRDWILRNEANCFVKFGGEPIKSKQDEKLPIVDVLECSDNVTSVDEDETFRVDKYFSLLQSKGIRSAGRRLLYSPSVSSTQDTLFGKTFEGWEYWRLAYVADEQTTGKGRGENEWVSPKGCLMCSFQVTHRDGVKLPMMQYLISLTILDAIGELPNGSEVLKRKKIRIKWPNDIYCEDSETEGSPMAKIGGIICQSTYWKGEFIVTIGFGLNVSNEKPTQCIDRLFESCGFEAVGREAILAKFFTLLEKYLEEFERTGFETFKERYEASWMHSGQRLKLEDGSIVVVEGITDDGLLKVYDVSTGESHALQPDGNSLNWFQGLIKRKA